MIVVIIGVVVLAMGMAPRDMNKSDCSCGLSDTQVTFLPQDPFRGESTIPL